VNHTWHLIKNYLLPGNTSLSILKPACLFAALTGIIPGKNAFPKSSLPTATLPKAMLLFSLLLPAAKL